MYDLCLGMRMDSFKDYRLAGPIQKFELKLSLHFYYSSYWIERAKC